jgi:hypothetical protein
MLPTIVAPPQNVRLCRKKQLSARKDRITRLGKTRVVQPDNRAL